MKTMFVLRSLLYGIVCATLVALPAHADQPLAKKWFPGHYLYANGNKMGDPIIPMYRNMVKDNPDFRGYHTRYSWAVLEPQKGNYDFSLIRQDLKTATLDGKKLIVHVHDRNHTDTIRIPVPEYITTDPIYEGGIYEYYAGPAGRSKLMPKIWVLAYAERLGALLAAIGHEFDDHPALAYVTLEESAIIGADQQAGFTSDRMLEGYKTIHSIAVTGLKKTIFSQWVNWRTGLSEAHASEMIRHLVKDTKSAFGGPDALAIDRAAAPGSGASIGALDNAFGWAYVTYRGIAPITMSAQMPSMQVESPLASLNYAIDELGAHFITWAPQTGSAWSIGDAIEMLRKEGARINQTPPAMVVADSDGGGVLRAPQNLRLHFE